MREKTLDLIKRAHAGQTDKAGQPYYLHPVAVADLLPADADEDEYLAALLHDVLEDTEMTEADLRGLGYSEKTIAIVKLLTRPPVCIPRADRSREESEEVFERAFKKIVPEHRQAPKGKH